MFFPLLERAVYFFSGLRPGVISSGRSRGFLAPSVVLRSLLYPGFVHASDSVMNPGHAEVSRFPRRWKRPCAAGGCDETRPLGLFKRTEQRKPWQTKATTGCSPNGRRNQDGAGRTCRRRGTPGSIPAPAGVRAHAHSAAQANTLATADPAESHRCSNQSAEKSGRAPKPLDSPVRNVAVGWQQSQAGIPFTGPSSVDPLSGARLHGFGVGSRWRASGISSTILVHSARSRNARSGVEFA